MTNEVAEQQKVAAAKRRRGREDTWLDTWQETSSRDAENCRPVVTCVLILLGWFVMGRYFLKFWSKFSSPLAPEPSIAALTATAPGNEPAYPTSPFFCEALGKPVPDHIAVVARWDEDVAWTNRLPLPVLVYNHANP